METVSGTRHPAPRSEVTKRPAWQPQPIRGEKTAICAEVIAGLPEWFARPEANSLYARRAADLDMLGCRADDAVAGFVSLTQHFDTTGEIYLLAARRRWHGTGLGRSLVGAAERWARARGLRYLSVKTLGPSHPDPFYDHSRRFYLAMGFAPIEEIQDIWPGNPCLLLLKPLD